MVQRQNLVQLAEYFQVISLLLLLAKAKASFYILKNLRTLILVSFLVLIIKR